MDPKPILIKAFVTQLGSLYCFVAEMLENLLTHFVKHQKNPRTYLKYGDLVPGVVGWLIGVVILFRYTNKRESHKSVLLP